MRNSIYAKQFRVIKPQFHVQPRVCLSIRAMQFQLLAESTYEYYELLLFSLDVDYMCIHGMNLSIACALCSACIRV